MKRLAAILMIVGMISTSQALVKVLWDFETDLGGWGPGAGTVSLGTNPLTGSQCMVLESPPEGWQTGAYNGSAGDSFINLSATPIIQFEVTYVASEWGDVGWITQDNFIINSGGGWGQKGLSSGDGSWGSWAGDATRVLQYDYTGYNLSGGWGQLSIMINGGTPTSGVRGNYYIDNIVAIGPDPVTPWVRYECEEAELVDAAFINSDADCSGGQYVSIQKIDDAQNGQIIFTVNAPCAGTYNMRYGQNAFDKERYENIFVNDVLVADQQFAGNITWTPAEAVVGNNGWTDEQLIADLFSTVTLYGEQDGNWQVWSRWVPAWNEALVNTPMTVELNEGENTISIVAVWGWDDWDYIELELGYIAKNPLPADGGIAIIGQDTSLEWNNAILGLDKAEVWFGETPEPNVADPNTFITSANYKEKLTLLDSIANPSDRSSSPMPSLKNNQKYTWVVDGFKGVQEGGDPNYPGAFWTFTATDNAPPTANAGDDQYVWLAPDSVVVTLDASGSTDDGKDAPLTYQWTQLAGPAVTLDTPDAVSTTVTMTVLGNTTEAGTAAPYEFQLDIYDGLWTRSDTVTVHVNSNSCSASIEAGSFYYAGDISSAQEGVSDCKVDLYDFVQLANDWLACSNIFEACE